MMKSVNFYRCETVTLLSQSSAQILHLIQLVYYIVTATLMCRSIMAAWRDAGIWTITFVICMAMLMPLGIRG